MTIRRTGGRTALNLFCSVNLDALGRRLELAIFDDVSHLQLRNCRAPVPGIK